MIHHCGTQPIETERFLLRRFRPEDAEAMYRNWASDPETTRFLQWSPHGSVQETREIILRWILEYENLMTYHWVIELRETGEIIGAINAHNLSGANEHAEVGYSSGPRFWGKGYMTEALRGLIGYLFTSVGLHRIAGLCDVDNIGSARVMEKAGMKLDGVLREYNRRPDGAFSDARVYSILAREAGEA